MSQIKQSKKMPDAPGIVNGNQDTPIIRENKDGDTNLVDSTEYKNRSYEELSTEFKHSVSKAAEPTNLSNYTER